MKVIEQFCWALKYASLFPGYFRKFKGNKIMPEWILFIASVTYVV